MSVVSDEGGLILVGTVIARARGDGTKAFDRGDEGEAALFWVVLVEDKGVALATQRIEAEAPRPVDEQGEFVVGRVARDRAPYAGGLTIGVSSVRLIGGGMVRLG